MKNRKILTIILALLTVISSIAIPTTASASTRTETDLMSKITWAHGYTNINTGIQSASFDANWLKNSNTYIDVSDFEAIHFDFSDTNYKFNVFWYDSEKKYIGCMEKSNTLTHSGQEDVTVGGTYANFAVFKRGGADENVVKTFTISGVYEKYENLINSGKKGSLTINKYEMGDISKATNKGTGEESDRAKVPSDAKLFKGVTFKLTQIAGLDDAYFQGKGTPLPTPAKAKTMTAIGTPVSKATNDNGIVKFDNLPLGIYLVEETATPNHVLKKSPDFVISIPFTSVNQKEWIYNCVVFPKNETKYSDLKIHKYDYAENSKSLRDTEFKLEIKNSDNTWTTVKDNLITDSNGNVVIKGLPVNNTYQISETKAPKLYILDTTNNKRQIYIDKEGKVCAPNKVPYNFDNDPTLFKFTPNTKPEIEKWIDKSRGKNTELVKETTFGHRSENDRNYYTIIVTTPNIDLNKLKVFSVTDQINDTLKAPVVESVRENNTTEISKGAAGYTTAITNDNHVTVNFSTANNTVIKKNTKYYISVSCFHSLTAEPILNQAQLEYTFETGTDKTEKIKTQITRTITAAFEFLKTDEKGNPLAGAKFSLYKTEEDAKNNKNAISVTQKEGEPYRKNFVSGTDGKVKFIYVEFGDDVDKGSDEYWISEIESPKGYQLLGKPEKIKISRTSYSYSNTQMKIINIRQPDLPRTGGYSVVIPPVFGFISLSAAGILFYIKRKKKADK